MLYRAGILLCALTTALAAADLSELVPKPTGAQALNPRDLKGLSNKNFNELLMKALSNGNKVKIGPPRQASARSRACSIPLLEVPVDRTEHFSMKTISPGPRMDGSMAVPNPAPDCKNWAAQH